MSAFAITDAPIDAVPIDAVFVCVTRTIELDYERRGVFPNLRSSSAFKRTIHGSEYRLTLPTAQSALDDAIRLKELSRGGGRVAYRRMIERLERGIQSATSRRAMADSLVATCRVDLGWCETWWGTKQQLVDKGIRSACPWPQELGGRKTGQAKGTDWRDYEARIRPLSQLWPSFYEVDIFVPKDQRKGTLEDRNKAAKDAQESLTSMLGNEDAFRDLVIERLRSWVAFTLDFSTTPSNRHGYIVASESVDEIKASFDAVVDAVLRAKVHFDPVFHAKIAESWRAEIAAGDNTFQTRFAELVRENAALLDGELQ